MNRFTRWLSQLLTAPRSSSVPVSINISHAVLCESCHHIVTIAGYIVAISGNGDACPRCGAKNMKDQTVLKLVAAWIRTEEEQRLHWQGRHRFVKALSGGEPKPLPPLKYVRPGGPKDAA